MDGLGRRARVDWERAAASYQKHCDRQDTWNVLVEAPAMLKLIGPVRDKRVLDVACGAGRYAISLHDRGAKVTALEPSPTLLTAAKHNAGPRAPQIDWRLGADDLMQELPTGEFDIVLFAMMLEYVDDILEAFEQAHRLLSRDGFVAASVVHPVRMGSRREDLPGMQQAVVVDQYLSTGTATFSSWLTDAEDEPVTFTSHHRTVEQYVEAFRQAEFVIEQILEPAPIGRARTVAPRIWEEGHRCPQFMLLKAAKRDAS